MDKAEIGTMCIGFFRIGVFRHDWDQLLNTFGDVTSCDATRLSLFLGSRDSVTGWYEKLHSEIAIEGLLISRATSHIALNMGLAVRSDALFCTTDPLLVGDEFKTESGVYYEVKTMNPHYFGDSFAFRECDLTLLPFHQTTSGGQPTATVNDARTNTKTYLETYLNNLAPAQFIVAFGNPDYPITHVFWQRGIDLVFSVGEPNSTALVGHDQKAYGYEEHVPIRIFAIDKVGITGTKLKWAGEAELRRICEEHPLGSLRSLERRRNIDQNLGSTRVYGTEFMMNYRRDTA